MASSSTATKSAKITPPRNWLELPPDVTAAILSRLTVIEILTSAQLVCKSWLDVSKDPLCWTRIHMYRIGRRRSRLNLEKMLRCAVDRSSGRAVDFTLENFVTNDTLKYITDRSTHIKYLRLTGCDQISTKAWIETVEKLPLLEELELTFCRYSKARLEAVGRHCPRLKSLKLNTRFEDFDSEDDEEEYKAVDEDENDDEDEDDDEDTYEDEGDSEAIIIAKNMPELRHLQMIENSIDDKGLIAILDGCPKLESLDLRKCNNFNTKILWEKGDQVQRLRLPAETINEYPFYKSEDDYDSSDFGGFSPSPDSKGMPMDVYYAKLELEEAGYFDRYSLGDGIDDEEDYSDYEDDFLWPFKF